MGVLLLNSNHTIRSILRENHSEVVTLLVPKRTLLGLDEKQKKFLPKRIPFLLKRYAKYLSSTKRLSSNSRKTLYQPSFGKNQMVRMNVRVGTGSWALLGLFAQVHGVSRCYLFNFLVNLDRVGVGESIVSTMNEGGPTFHSNYSYILHLDLLGNRITRSLKCDPIDSFYVLNYQEWFDS
ncbi:DUF1564 domain-containing protein [Leptospira sp. FAT2]|uniref:DUF1564 domain-containing protein n=1 Tax=Leptospira sanjuanensis TaxID=2879643 RepID=UPI001EE8D7C6|nr:DUF1564 domain-containing protein [Leptospira sanjuanensis]MCG6194950.1 DUF1564 domain-containing protein [Leptospira sanjuanensis]